MLRQRPVETTNYHDYDILAKLCIAFYVKQDSVESMRANLEFLDFF